MYCLSGGLSSVALTTSKETLGRGFSGSYKTHTDSLEHSPSLQNTHARLSEQENNKTTVIIFQPL